MASAQPLLPTLVAAGIRVARGGKVILRGVDLRARAGDVVGVLGPSGAGKSTLFRALVGEHPPDAGTIELLGQNVTRWPLWKRARAGVGYVPQEPSVLWDLTVLENLVAYRQIAGARATGADARASARRVGLENQLHVRAGALSGGERRRLELARALTCAPRLLVCDEPFAGVDPAGAEGLGRLLRDVASEGAAVLLADHHVSEALRICTVAVLLLDGAVAVTAASADFPSEPLVRGRYLGTWESAPTQPPSRGPRSQP